MLTTEQLIFKTLRVIGGHRHKWYEYTIEKSEFYSQLCTGIGQEELVLQYKERETIKQKEQRIRLTHTRTKSAANKIKAMFNRVFEVDKLKDTIAFKENGEDKIKMLRERIAKFKGQKSLEKYLNDATLYYNFTDPNAFLLIAYTAATNAQGEIIDNPVSFPVEIPSANVADFGYMHRDTNGELKYFITCEKKHVAGQPVLEYYSYSPGLQIYTVEILPELVEIQYYPPNPTQTVKQGKKDFFVYVTEVTTTSVPAMRFGYIPDYASNRENFVSVLDAAEFEFRDLINRKSEYDISLALHTFMQKLQIAEPCEFQDGNDTCINGQLTISQESCPACNGSGLQIATTAQQTLLVKRGEGEEKQIPLSQMVHYVQMPFEIVKHQSEIVAKLPREISVTIFGVDITERPVQNTTATAIINYFDSVYAVLGQFADQYSELYTFSVNMVAQNAALAEGLQVEHKFPSDFELMSLGELIGILAAAKNAGAPDEIISKIEEDILSKQNQDNPVLLQTFRAKRDFKPFKNIPQPVLQTTLNSLPNTDTFKIMYLYNDVIFSNIVKSSPDFSIMPPDAQQQIIAIEVQKIREILQQGEGTTLREVVQQQMPPETEEEGEQAETTE